MDTAITVPTVVRRVVDAALAAAWDDLADRAGVVPFARPGWLLPWAEAAGVRLAALTAWRGPLLTGVLPVVEEAPAPPHSGRLAHSLARGRRRGRPRPWRR